MSQLKELLAQVEALQSQIAEVRARETEQAIKTARDLISEYQLKAEDIFPGGKRKATNSPPRTKVAAKYSDPATGKTWSGRGLAPKWLQGKNKADYLIS
jgi:DNA-binding protein H-NS